MSDIIVPQAWLQRVTTVLLELPARVSMELLIDLRAQARPAPAPPPPEPAE